MKLFINELLTNYFSSASYKIMFCLACLEEKTELIDDIIKILKKSVKKKEKKSSSKSKFKKNSKSNLNFKIYLLLKYYS